MKKINKILFALLPGIVFSISSCAILDKLIPLPNPDNGGNGGNKDPNPDIKEDKTYKNLEKVDTKFTYDDLGTAQGVPVTPSTGDVNVLVIPVEFSDRTAFTSSDLTALNASFNGTKEDKTNSYWESVSSFYNKSSYGKLNLNFEICDTYVPSMTSTNFLSMTDDYGTESCTLLYEMYNKGITKNGAKINYSDSKYDNNSDGFIDGVWLIYNEKNPKKVNSSNFWAYTTNYNEPESSPKYNETNNSTKFSKYANCALSFIYEDSRNGEDAHTLIHETGHMLGLDDYYSYSSKITKNYGYCGGLDMMDLNIGDHDAFSKRSLNWISPSIVKEDTENIKLRPFQSSGDALILPANYFNNSAFSEYIILTYYTPNGLNYLDSANAYQSGSYPRLFTKSGLVAYHVDSRLINLTITQSFLTGNKKTTIGDYLDKNATKIPEESYKETATSATYSYYSVATSNTPEYSYNKSALISLLTPQNRSFYNSRVATNADLYTESTKALSSKTASNFFSYGKFNDGSTMSYVATVNEITDDYLTVSITK